MQWELSNFALQQMRDQYWNISTNDIAGMGGPGGMDLGAFLNNPALMNMATTMMSDPNMQNM